MIIIMKGGRIVYKRKARNYKINYVFCKNKDGLDFIKIIERLFIKFLIEYE